MIDSVICHIIIVSKYNLLAGSSYIKLPKQLNHQKDNESFKGCLVRYLHPADHHPARVGKIDKLFGDE